MVNPQTQEDYANDGNGVTFLKLNTTLKESWEDWKPLAFPDLEQKQSTKTKMLNNNGCNHDNDGNDSAVITTSSTQNFRTIASKDLREYLSNDAEVVNLDDDNDDGSEENKYEMLNMSLKLCAFKIGCFMNLFYSIKNSNRNANDNNEISSIVTLFTKYFNEFEYRNCKSGYRFLLSGINVCDKENASIFDMIDKTYEENDYLKKVFISKYSNLHGVSPTTSSEKELEYVLLSSEMLNHLKKLGLENIAIKKTEKFLQVVEMSVDLKQGATLSTSKVDILQILLNGFYCHYIQDANRLSKFRFEGNDFENVIKLGVSLFGAEKQRSKEMKLSSFVKNDTKLESSVIFDKEKHSKLRKDVLKT